jgi:glutathione S-transferase
MAGDRPILWHIAISHYNEKVRWALDYKGIDAERREPMPGAHMLVALVRTGGRSKTFPMLRLDGETIGDSTEIIAALERRYPEPPLYPEDPEERRRALALEDFFDEELAPHSRLLAFHEARKDRETMALVAAPLMPRALRPLAAPISKTFVALRYGAGADEAAELARNKVLAAFDRLESELDGRDYLVGDRFTVADLTAASLFYPLVLPPEGPRVPVLPEAYERFRGPLKARPGFRWVEEIFRRHRKPATAPRAAAIAS